MGWAAYKAFGNTVPREMWPALSAAADFDVGNSRSLGFGAVKITPT